MADLINSITDENIALRAKVEELETRLAPFLEREAEEAKEEAFKERLSAIVNICCPKYDGRKENPPLRHPDTACWWNGASIGEHYTKANGDVEVELQSYVGGGNYDDHTLTLKKEWFEVENYTEVLHKFFKEETIRVEAAKKAKRKKEIDNEIYWLEQSKKNLDKQ